jgi:uncharacterized protein (DUF488 family)
VIYTIGHSNHPIERFVGLLTAHGIAIVADVRSRPFSRFHPQFNRGALRDALLAADIGYEFLGDSLGARVSDPDCIGVAGRVSYARLAAAAHFRTGLQRVRELMRGWRVALMCAEREPLDCHRTILVGRELERSGTAVVHILGDGGLEPNEHAIERLAQTHGLDTSDLFLKDPAALRDAAYDAQAARLAWQAQPAAKKLRQVREK